MKRHVILYTLSIAMTYDPLTRKKKELDSYRPLPPAPCP